MSAARSRLAATLLATVVLSSGFSATAYAAPAGDSAQMQPVAASPSSDQIGDWNLVVGPRQGPCYSWEDPAWCGNALFVRSNAFAYGDAVGEVQVRGNLTGPAGAVAFEHDSISSLSNGSNGYDDTYWGQYAAWDSAVNPAWAPGAYTFTVQMDSPGKWVCSQYNPNGCSWRAPWSITKVWEFIWSGQRMIVAPAQLQVLKAPVITGKNTGGKLKLKAATWKTAPSKVTYRWFRNGKRIADATTGTYKTVNADKGKKITVTVTGTRSGYATGSATSVAFKIKKQTRTTG